MIVSERALMDRVLKMLPNRIPAIAIRSVECDSCDGDNGGSYWVNLAAGWICNSTGCHTIHEDTLKDLRVMVRDIREWPDDPSLSKL